MRRDTSEKSPSDLPASHLRAHVLGPVRITIGDRVIAEHDWPRRSARSLFLLLLATQGHSLSRERIIDLLWPEMTPDAGMNTLRVALHAVRRTLEPTLQRGEASAYLNAESELVSLRTSSDMWVDADQFDSAIERLASVSGGDRIGILRAALACYGGELLEGHPDVEWAVGRRERLRRAWRDAVLEVADLEMSHGSLASLPSLQQMVSTDPSDEAAHRALMRTYLAADQRDEALRQYARCVEALRRELDVEPAAETQALAAEIRSAAMDSDLVLPRLPEGRIENLPSPPSALIGRARELEKLDDLLLDPDVRLITLTGPGGIGKTRIALEAARIAAREFSRGVCFVDLSAVLEPELVIPTILRTLGLEEVPGTPATQVLMHALRELELLLVLDNLEQVIESSTDIGTLLATCPDVMILATSRQQLNLRAEHMLALPPLSVPPVGLMDGPDQRTSNLTSRYDAVALFVERARAVQPDFQVTEVNELAVAAVCSRLDGLPLAIELAAAHSRHLNPVELLAQLEPRLPMLIGGARDLPARQRRLRDAIAWSYGLLDEKEQEMFRRCAIFSGDFSLEAAQGICSPPHANPRDQAGYIWSLADKSLLQPQEASGEVRYKMLETIREFALDQLTATEEWPQIQRRHADWFLQLAEGAASHLHGPDQIAWLERLEQEHDNFRTALEWANEGKEAETALRLGGALSQFWRMNGYLSEGRAWLDRALTLASTGPSGARALCLRGAGQLAQAQGDSDEATIRLNQALDDWRALGDQRSAGQTIGLLADIARARGEYDQSVDLNEQALVIFEGIDFAPGVADSLNQLGIIASDRAEYIRAEDFFQRSSEIFDRLGDRHGSARVLNNLGSLSFWQENYQEAVSFYERSLSLWRALGHRPHTALVLANLGESLRADGDLEQAMATTLEGLQVSREVGDKRSEATAQFILGSLIQHHQYDIQAIDPLVHGFRLYHQVGDRLGMAWCLEALAGGATGHGLPEMAAQFLGAAESMREAVGIGLKPAERAAYQRHLDDTREAFDSSEAFAESWQSGRSLSSGDLLRMASELVDDPSDVEAK